MTAGLLYLDDASSSGVQAAADSGIVSGVTTNPTILKRAGGGDLIEAWHRVYSEFPAGPVFFQVHAQDAPSRMRQVEQLLSRVRPERVVLKLPAQNDWYSLGAELVGRGLTVAFTAVYQPGQYLAASQVGAAFVIPYVDRATRLRAGAPGVVEQLNDHRVAGGPSILAASIKSPEQALTALRQGADAITAPWQVLRDLVDDELTDSAVAQFCSEVPW